MFGEVYYIEFIFSICLEVCDLKIKPRAMSFGICIYS